MSTDTEDTEIWQQYPMPWTCSKTNIIISASGDEVPLHSILQWIGYASEELEAIKYAAHMPSDYAYGLPSWINQHLYGRLIELLDHNDRPIRRSEDIKYMIAIEKLIQEMIIEIRKRDRFHIGMGLEELAFTYEKALEAITQRHQEVQQINERTKP